jgi:hypothetical protein
VKQALQVTIVLSVSVLVAASCGLALRLSGYLLVDPFGSILPRESAAMSRELWRWIVYFGVSLGVTIWLLAVYRKCKRTLWKSD